MNTASVPAAKFNSNNRSSSNNNNTASTRHMSMKSLPRTPVSSTASTLTATMMAKAFQNNHHKRGLVEMMAPPPTPTAPPSSSSYLDCQSLQSSLKRVRLSSSPGELRLQRDLRHLVSSGAWVPKDGSGEVWLWHPPEPPVTVRANQQKQPSHIELHQVESLRLRLTFQHSVVAWIQIPRMYPHRPPLISRIVYNDNVSTIRNYNPNAGSSFTNAINKPSIQSIVVQEAPPMRAGSLDEDAGEGQSSSSLSDVTNNPSNYGSGANNSDHSIYCANAVLYQNWSPVQRLGDLLEFVIAVFQQQHEEHLKISCNSCTTNDVSLSYSSSTLSSTSSCTTGARSCNSSLSSTTAFGGGYNRTSSSSSVMFPGWSEEQEHDSCMSMAGRDRYKAANLAEFLTPNRFDVGYDRSISATGMDVDTHSNATVVSMMEDL